MAEQPDVFEVGDAPPELRARAAAIGAPHDLVDRMLAASYPRWKVELALAGEPFSSLDVWVAELVDRERLTTGLTVRQATWEDDERLSDLFAQASERLGDWDVYVERSPNPFAQHRLQENAQVKLIVERGVALAASAQAGRSSLVGGQRLSVAWMGGWRVRNGFRRNGFAGMLLSTPGPACGVFGMLSYWYVRLDNGTATQWISHAVETTDVERARAFDKLSATVHHLDPSAGRHDPRVRPIRPDDVGRCVELVNATHAGLDLFRPYTVDALETRLHDLFWGPRPPFVPTVYGWPDMAVLEERGRIVACAGLWDRGRDVRERWRHRDTGQERTIDTACVLDLGYAPGCEQAAAALVRHHLATTRALGRTTLTAALEFLPGLLDALADTAPRPETRSLETMVYASPELRVDVTLTRPYTDLAYW